MGMDNLSSYEKDLLLSLSYLDIPSEYKDQVIPMNELIKIMGTLDKNKIGNEERFNKIKNYLDANTNSPLNDFKLVGHENHNGTYKSTGESNNNVNDKSGLVAYAFDDGNGNGTILYRGSESDGIWNLVTDWGSNLVAGLGGTIKQQEQALEFYNKYKNGFNETMLMGHSKGGNLASYVFINSLNDNIKAYVLNGQPLNWFGLSKEQQESLKGDKYTFNVIDGDFVSYLGFSHHYIDKYIKFQDGKYDGFFDPHNEGYGQYNNNNEHIIEESPYKNFWGQGLAAVGLSYIVSSINLAKDSQGKSAFFMDITSSVVINAYNKLRPIAESTINIVSEAISKIVGAGKQFADNLADFFKDLQNTVLGQLKNIKTASKVKVVNISGRIAVDIQRIISYEQQLRQLKVKINNVNNRIDNLYFKVGLLGIDNILRADILTSGTNKINKVISSLQNTRTLLENNEKILKIKAQKM